MDKNRDRVNLPKAGEEKKRQNHEKKGPDAGRLWQRKRV